MKLLRRKVFVASFLSVLVVAVACLAYLNSGFPFSPYKELRYELGREVGAFGRLCRQLERDRVIRSSLLMKAMARLTGVDKKVHAGSFLLHNRMSVWFVLRQMTAASSELKPFLIREGDDLLEVAMNLQHLGLAASAKAALSYLQSDEVLGAVAARFRTGALPSLEGFLYPDTYLLNPNHALEDLVRLALDEFEEAIHKSFLSSPVSTEPKNLLALLTMASMIEKESSVPEERRWVSAVIHNRIERRQRLELCVSLSYILRQQRFESGRLNRGDFIRLYRKHFQIQSPYNTYVIPGLPIGPICSPSLQSFEAATNPVDENVLYFVSKGDGTGSHWFSATYKEHLRNTKRYKSNLKRYGTNFKSNRRLMRLGTN